jgi:protein gp37
MAETTGIAWTDSTFNPWIGCTKVSPGCDNCYASVSTPARSMRIAWGPGKPRHRTSAQNWKTPEYWNSTHEAFAAHHGRRRRVFCASLADVYDNEVPNEWRADLFALIDRTPQLDWLLLTKRVGNVLPMLQEIGRDRLPVNVWQGISAVNQDEARRDLPKLLRTNDFA